MQGINKLQIVMIGWRGPFRRPEKNVDTNTGKEISMKADCTVFYIKCTFCAEGAVMNATADRLYESQIDEIAAALDHSRRCCSEETRFMYIGQVPGE